MKQTITIKLVSTMMVFMALMSFVNLANAGVCTHTVSIAKVNPTCFGDCNGSVTANPSPAGGLYDYLWSNGATTKSVPNLCAGTYTVTVTDQVNQCAVVKSVIIKKGKVAASFQKTPASCGQCNGVITVIGNGGNGGPFTYLWSNGNTTNTITDACPGVNYYITVTDKLGCTFLCHAKVTNVGTTSNDNNACTLDGCDPVTGLPTYTPIVCDDNNECTTDACDPLTGCTYTPITCDDGNECTTDACDPETGCTYTPITCDDGDECTTDVCDPALGCVYTSIDTDDDDECTTDGCDPVTGPYHDPVTCNDNNPCTDDSCDPITGCVYIDNGSCDCDDDFTTYTQGGWHNNGAPGQYLVANFDACAANFVLGDPCGYTITFTSAAEIQEFLPQGGTPVALTQSQTDPGSADITVLAGQVLANGLALLFDDCDPNFGGSNSYLGDQIYDNAGSPFDGWSIQAIYDTARKALSGCPTNYDFSDLNDACTAINENYDGGGDNGNFVCPGVGSSRLSSADAKQLGVYPNPFNSSLTINVNTDEALTVTITDLSGRVVGSYNNVTSTFEVKNNWNQGMYFVTLQMKAESFKQVLKTTRTE